MAIKQLAIFAENKQGSIFETLGILAKANVDIRALSVAETMDFGILRLIVSDTDKAFELLQASGAVVSVTDVIGVQMPDIPGGLANVLSVLSDAGINIDYLYAFITTIKDHAYVVMRVADNAEAEKLLAEKGLVLLTEEDKKLI